VKYGNFHWWTLLRVTLIDHNSRTVLNGSALGKEFSTNKLMERFADFSTASREDLQPVSSALPHIEQRLEIQPDPGERPSVNVYSGDDSPIGSLFSVLTPEVHQHDNNQPAPVHRKKKKKKRRYGRQM